MNSQYSQRTTMFFLLSAIIVATLGAQISNYVAIQLYNSQAPYQSMFIAALYLIPISTIATFLFNVYFSQGYPTFNYSSLNIIAVGAAIFIGFVVEQCLKIKTVNIYELIGNIIIVIGVFIVLCSGNGS